MAEDIAEETVKKEDAAAEKITDGSDLDESEMFEDLAAPTRAQESLRLLRQVDAPMKDAPPDPAAAKVNKAYSQYRTDYLQGVEAGRAEGQQQAVRYAFAWIETVYGIGHAERYLAAWNAA